MAQKRCQACWPAHVHRAATAQSTPVPHVGEGTPYPEGSPVGGDTVSPYPVTGLDASACSGTCHMVCNLRSSCSRFFAVYAYKPMRCVRARKMRTSPWHVYEPMRCV
eukprot:366522-Chlamydomonas_euryale.AAC.13